jgi:predicted O-methyltransferase YrrM
VGWRSFSKAIAKPGRKVALAAHRLRYDLASADEEQNRLFSEWGLSRRDGLAAVERVLAAHPELTGSMQSEHYVLFGAISESRKPKRILEIGTFDGRGAGVLAALFPAARIDTLDLPDDHAAFKESYKRKDAAVRLNFIRKRDTLLAKFSNVTFEPLNSVALSNAARENYDLIWVDGDHGYPTVAIDIVNAFRLLNAGGLVMCDDVTKNPARYGHGANSMYASTGANDTLNAHAEAGLSRFTLIHKRLDPKSNADPRRRKFIALAEYAAR